MQGEKHKMRFHIVKVIFIVVVIAIIVFAIYSIYFQEKQDNTQVQNEAQAETIQEKKDIRLGISNYDTINPLLSTNKEVLNISKLIFEPLLMVDENYKIELCLATEWSKTSDTTYVVKIDNSVQWQDGSPLIAKDIQFTIDRLKEGKSIYSANVEKVISVEVVDASTVKINLSEPVPFFEYNLTFPILPNNYYLGEDFHTSTKIPIGTGMYKIASIDSQKITLERNEKWWKEIQPNIETVEIKLYTEIGELYNSFKLGNIDIFTTANRGLESYIGTMGYAKEEFAGRELDYLAFNCQDSLLQRTEVRKAIAYAIDKSNIVSTVYNNEYYVSNFPLDFGSYVYENTQTSSGYNIEQAKQILSSNGWEYKNNRWQKRENGKTLRLKFTLSVQQSNTQRLAVAENIKNQLEQIGITVTIHKVSDAEYQNILTNKNYQMLITGVYNGYSPDISSFFASNNLQNYTNETMQTLLKEVESIQEENLLKQKYQEILKIYQEEQPFICLYRNKVTVVKEQNLAGEVTPNNFFSYYHFEEWYRM